MDIPNASPSLYNEDLAPATVRNWGPFSIFNVWTDASVEARDGVITAVVPRHGVVLLRITP